MPSPTPRTVLVYNENLVIVAKGHVPAYAPELATLQGETPTGLYHVTAASDLGAVRAALIAERATQKTGNPVVARLAEQLGCNELQVIENALHVYAALKSPTVANSDVYVRSRNAEGTLVVKRLQVP